MPLKLKRCRYAPLSNEQHNAIVAVLKQLELEGTTFLTGYFMLAALQIGLDTVNLSSACGIPRDFIRPRIKRLRQQKVWIGKDPNVDWDDPEEGGKGFLMDIMVAEGLVRRGTEYR